MNKIERLQATIAGEAADRPPVALWRHFPVDDQDPDRLAESVLAFQRAFDFDWIKLTPASSYSVRDWGVEDEWRADPEGTREYTRPAVREPGDWARLDLLDPERGWLGAHLRCLERVVREAGPDTPVLPTVFSPLAQAKHLAGEDALLQHLHREPHALEAGLARITETTIRTVEACRRAGIAGIFYAIQHASFRYFDRAGYTRFGEAFDRQVLEAAGGLWLNVLHLHGDGLIFDLAETYPVAVVNWHDRHTEPGLAEGKRRVRGAVCGGLKRWETLVLGGPKEVRMEALDALGSVGGRGLVLGAGCVVPVLAPRANLLAAREAVDFA